MSSREKGARALAVGLLCWGINIALMRTVGAFGPALVILGALGVFFGAILLVWGDSFRTMPVAQKIPAALIALGAVAGLSFALLRWAQAMR